MPIAGDVTSLLARGEGIRSIRGAAASMVEQARALGIADEVGFTTVSAANARFSAIDQAVIDDAWSQMVRDIAWVNDGWCVGRAATGAQLVSMRAGHAPAVDALVSAIAVAQGPLRLPGGRTWNYHAAAAVLPTGATRPVVLDGLFSPRPMTIEAWAGRMGLSADEVRFVHPWNLVGTGYGDTIAEASSTMAARLEQSLSDATRSGQPLADTIGGAIAPVAA